MEQHIGHRAYYKNLRRFIDQIPEIDPAWVEITYQEKASIWRHFPIPGGLKGTLIGRSQSRRGLKKPSDAIFFNTQVPAVLSGSLVRQRPYLIATDITPIQYDQMGELYGHRPDRGRLLRIIKHHLNTHVLTNAAYLLPWSSWTGKSLTNDYGVNPSRIEVLHPGVDLEVWRPPQSKNSRPVRILFVGGDFHRKGGNLLLQAFQDLSRQLPASQLEIALVTRSQVPPINGVSVYSNLNPNSPDIIRLYQSSDVFVLPSLAEAFGIAAVEASAVGLPVVATKVGGLEDIVENDCSGFLIKPGDVQRLVDRLCLLVEDRALRVRMGQAGRNRAEQYFNASRNATRLIQIMNDIVGKDR